MAPDGSEDHDINIRAFDSYIVSGNKATDTEHETESSTEYGSVCTSDYPDTQSVGSDEFKTRVEPMIEFRTEDQQSEIDMPDEESIQDNEFEEEDEEV